MTLNSPLLKSIPSCDYPYFDVVVRSDVSVDRNLSNNLFVNKQNQSKRSVIKNIFSTAASVCGFSICDAGKLSLYQKSCLAEKKMYNRSFLLDDENLVVLNQAMPIWLTINEENHLSIHGADYGLAALDLWTNISKTDDNIEETIGIETWAFDPDFGYIMSDASFCGSGLLASVTVHIPALVMSGLVETAFKRVMEAGFVVTGAYSTINSSAGALFCISLPKIYHDTEASSLYRLETVAKTISDYERAARKSLLEKTPWDILDLVGRAAGRVLGAHLISRDESSDIISGLRLGVACDLLSGINFATVTDLWSSLHVKNNRINTNEKVTMMNDTNIEIKPEAALRADYLRKAAGMLQFTERYKNV